MFYVDLLVPGKRTNDLPCRGETKIESDWYCGVIDFFQDRFVFILNTKEKKIWLAKNKITPDYDYKPHFPARMVQGAGGIDWVQYISVFYGNSYLLDTLTAKFIARFFPCYKYCSLDELKKTCV